VSLIWDKCQKLQNHVIAVLQMSGQETSEPHMEKFNHDGWTNRVWQGTGYRRAHVDVVDATHTKKLWMMHVCIMPHLHNSGPIYGLDIIAGERKVTGFFLDYSMSQSQNTLTVYYEDAVKNTEWNKQRDLPEWAKAIFSDHMVAAGNIQDPDELDTLCNLAADTLEYYTEYLPELNHMIDEKTGRDTQNTYAHHQRSNPHTPRVMKNLGLDENLVDEFCGECLFPVLT